MSTLFLLVIFGFVAWAMARTVQKQASGGGGLAFVGISVLVGALFARPSADDPAKSPSP